MNIFDKALSTVGLARKGSLPIEQWGIRTDEEAWFPRYSDLSRDDYENAYENINTIADEAAKTIPTWVDNKGKAQDNPILTSLLMPNSAMDGDAFRRNCIRLSFTRGEFYIRVLHNSKVFPIAPENINGFELIEASRYRRDGRYYYQLSGGGKVLSGDEIMLFPTFDPNDIHSGLYPATKAAQRWLTIEDYIAEYQKGFFRNGATASGMYRITALSRTDYKDIKSEIIRTHQGVGKNSNVMFSYAPFDPKSGKVQAGQIEWIPFNTTNKDLAMKDLMDQATVKKDRVFHVPEEVMGYVRHSNEAGIKAARPIFIERAVEPVVRSFYARFNHEIARICGYKQNGMLTYKIEMPMTPEERKQKNEADKVRQDAITSLIKLGYAVDSAQLAFDSGDYTKLKEKPEASKPIDTGNNNPSSDQQANDSNNDALNDPTNNQAEETQKSISSKQISARDIPDLYEGIDINPDELGCIMLDVQKLKVKKFVDNADEDLFDNPKWDNGSIPAETVPHVTLLYGLLENGNLWKDKVDALLEDWEIDTLTIENVDYFDTPDSYAVIAHVKKTPELVDGHERLTLLPHINTFSEYRPHITLAYVKKEADVDKWVKALNKEYKGKEVKTKSINYGDLPEDAKGKAVASKYIPDDSRWMQQISAETIVSQHLISHTNLVLKKIDDKRRGAKSKAPGDEVNGEYQYNFDETDVELADEDQSSLDEALSAALYLSYLQFILYQGPRANAEALTLCVTNGIPTSGVPRDFVMSDQSKTVLDNYFKNVAKDFNTETQLKIQNIVKSGIANKLSPEQITEQVRQVGLDEYRARRIAVTETTRAGNRATLIAMQNLNEMLGDAYQVYKTPRSRTGNPCPLCQSFIGNKVAVDKYYWKVGDNAVDTAGAQYINGFIDVEESCFHPNCECEDVYTIEEVS